MQAGEDWAESSIVLNSQSKHQETQRGVYKLLSKEDACLPTLLNCNFRPVYVCLTRGFVHDCVIQSKDLLLKYHGNQAVVEELIKTKDILHQTNRYFNLLFVSFL